MLPQLSLVIGGAASGKSDYGEALASSASESKVYVATAQGFDDEMRAKIAAHKAARGSGWHTVEAPHDLPAALNTQPSGAVVLVDCATMWLSNRLLADAEIAPEMSALLAALGTCASPVIVVTNEVGQGIVPDSGLGRRFRNEQGRLNRRLAEQADLVALVTAGLPLALKGQLPEGI